MKKNVAPISGNQKHHVDRSLSHQPANAGDFSAELETTQKFVLGRKSSLRQVEGNDKPRSSVHFNDTLDCIDPAGITHFGAKPKSLLQSKSSTRMGDDQCHNLTSKRPTIHKNSNKLDASRCEMYLDAPKSNALITENFDGINLKKSKSVPATRVTVIADHPKPKQTFGDFCAELEKTLERKSSLRQVEGNDKPRPSVHFNDTLECIETADLTHFGGKSKFTSTTRMSDDQCHTLTSKRLTIHKNSNKLDASRCEFYLDAQKSNAFITEHFDGLNLKKSKSVPATRVTDIAVHPNPRQKWEPARINENDNITHKLSSFKLSEDIKPHFADANLNIYTIEKFETKISDCSKTHTSDSKTEDQKTTNEFSKTSRKSDMKQKRCRKVSSLPKPSTTSDDHYDEFHGEKSPTQKLATLTTKLSIIRQPTIESTTQVQEGSDNVRATSRASTKSQQHIRQMSPIPGPSSRNDDYYYDFPCEPVTENRPHEKKAQSVQYNPNENVAAIIPFDFLNQYLHVFEHNLERVAVHVKYGQIAGCTCNLYDITDPCIKHIATEKLQYFAETMEVMQAYSDVYVGGPEYFEAENLIQKLCPNVYQSFLETPHELTDEDYYARCFVSEQNVVKTVIRMLKEEDHLIEFLQIELKIGEKRCLFDDDENDDFNLAIAFLIQEYPSLFVQLCLEYEFFQLSGEKCIVNENRKKIMNLSKLTREELIEFNEQFPQLKQQ